MLIFSIVIFVFSTLTLSPVPFAWKSGGHDPPAPMGAPPLVIGAKDDGGGNDNWSYKTCKALVKSSPPAYQHASFKRPSDLVVTQPTMPKH